MTLEERLRQAISEVWTSPFPTVDGALTITRAVLEALRDGQARPGDYWIPDAYQEAIEYLPQSLDEVRKIDQERSKVKGHG